MIFSGLSRFQGKMSRDSGLGMGMPGAPEVGAERGEGDDA